MKRLNKILGTAILVTIALSLMACGKTTDKKNKNITEDEVIKYINELKESSSLKRNYQKLMKTL